MPILAEFKKKIAALVEERKETTAESIKDFHQSVLDELLVWLNNQSPRIFQEIEKNYRYVFNNPEYSEVYQTAPVNEMMDSQPVHSESMSCNLPLFYQRLNTKSKSIKVNVKVYYTPKSDKLKVEFNLDWDQKFSGYEQFAAPIVEPEKQDKNIKQYFDLITHDPEIILLGMFSDSSRFSASFELK